jgi:hypothetical protein
MGLIREKKGSLTVEAAVILPLFLCFFFLLTFIVKAACIHVTLDHAVRETAKEIAATAYPLSYINEAVDELKEENDGLPDKLGEYFGELMTGTIDESKLQKMLLAISGGEFTERLGFSWKKQLQYEIAESILKKNLQGTVVNADEVVLCRAEFPQSDWEYENKRGNNEKEQQDDSNRPDDLHAAMMEELLPDRDFEKDDIVIELEYRLAVPLALLKERPIVFRHAAVERAWLNGGNGVYSNREERGIYEQKTDARIVYVTRTGVKYHREGCRYLQKSKIPLELKEAKKSYGVCKVCRPQPAS